MKLEQDSTNSQAIIDSYDPAAGELRVTYHAQKVTYTTSLIITPQQAPIVWQPQSLIELESGDFDVFLNLDPLPSVILLGTGPTHQLLSPEKYQALINAQIPVEIMSTPAACRTFTVLSSEDRAVATGLLVG